MPEWRYACVAVLDKPWNFVSTPLLEIDAGVTMMLYEGCFQDHDLARLIKPLGSGDICTFPRQSNSVGFAWSGRVDHLVVKHRMLESLCITNNLSCSFTVTMHGRT